MTAFDKAWAIAKMPRTLEEITHYEAGRCPSCEGTGQQLITVGSGNTDDSTSFAHARELAGKDTSYHMMECVSCNGTGVPDDEVWGDEGVMELEDFGKSEEKGKFRGYSKNTVSGRAERQGIGMFPSSLGAIGPVGTACLKNRPPRTWRLGSCRQPKLRAIE